MRNGARSRRRRSAHRPQAERQDEEAAHQHRDAPQQLDPGRQLRADHGAEPCPEVAGDGRLVADGELLVVGGDPQGVAAGGGERRPEHRHVAHQPRRQHQQIGDGRACTGEHGTLARPDPPRHGRRHGQQEAIDAGQGGHAGQRAGGHQPPGRARRAHRSDGAPDGARPGRAEQGGVVDLRIQDQERPGEEREHARRPGHPPRAPQLPAHEGGERHQRGRQQHERKLGRAPAAEQRLEDGDRGRRHDRGERHPVAVARDGQGGIGGQLAADLQEAPQRRGGEAMPIGQLLGDHEVVGRIGVRRVVDQPGRPDPNEKGQAEQDQQVPPAHRRPQITAVESSYSRSHSGESSSQRDSSQSGGSTAWSMP